MQRIAELKKRRRFQRHESQASLYTADMGRNTRRNFTRAHSVRGIDQEVALLRFRLRQLLVHHPDDDRSILNTVTHIIRAVPAQARIAKESPENPHQGIYNILKDASEHLGLTRIPWGCECGPECHSKS